MGPVRTGLRLEATVRLLWIIEFVKKGPGIACQVF